MSRRRVTLVTYELRGLSPVGGMGTSTTFLALALARAGHSVEILYGRPQTIALDPYWDTVFATAGIRIRSAAPSGEHVASWRFGLMRNVELALRADPPDVVIAHDFAAPAYFALQLRHAGLAYESTLFVVYCHGPRSYLLQLARTPYERNLRDVLLVSAVEPAALELADVAVSPSAYLFDWMREQGWVLPERTAVIPYFTRSAADGEEPTPSPAAERIERVTFFGRLDEKKGVQELAAGLDALDTRLLEGLELQFLGKPTASWPRERVDELLSERTKRALRRVAFDTDLDQPAALESLRRPGTLAVMPSLQDNSPNTVYECLEHGIPFVASAVGGVPELVADADRARVLFEPSAEGVARALRLALSDTSFPPARPAFSVRDLDEKWAEVVELRPRPRQSSTPPEPFVLVKGEDDVPDDELLETLQRAQACTDADVVTCAARVEDAVHFFSGRPGGLAVLSNDYGAVALVRRSLVEDLTTPVWPLLARLAVSGARIVSVPLPLVTSTRPPGAVEHDPHEALLVVEELERALPPPLRSLARLASGLAADAARPAETTPPSTIRRALRRLRRYVSA